jgi:hypothetical protein
LYRYINVGPHPETAPIRAEYRRAIIPFTHRAKDQGRLVGINSIWIIAHLGSITSEDLGPCNHTCLLLTRAGAVIEPEETHVQSKTL